MFKSKFVLGLLSLLSMVSVNTAYISVPALQASAEENLFVDCAVEQDSFLNGEDSTRLFTNLQIVLNGGNGEVWTSVKNTFTLFPSTVLVIVQLYVSDVYCEDYRDMTLVASNSTTDLDMGNTIEARASTEGRQAYWMGRMRYKIDGDPWDERTVGVGLYSATGEFLGLI